MKLSMPIIGAWLDRHKKLFAVLAFAWLMIMSAHHARFIQLPEIVKLPFWLSGILIGARYAIWDGMFKPHLKKAADEQGKIANG